jgi:indolepyruvate ferredoxin oxidoreductase, beta subunit
MKCDIIFAGVGGQGVLSLSAIIASSALKEGLHVKQAEVHGMAQRGGAVVADLRISDEPIYSNLIPRGQAEMVVSMEPLESLRYLDFLSPAGSIFTSDAPEINIPDYPDLEQLLATIRAMPRTHIIAAEKLARAAGTVKATNMVMAGAASRLTPLKTETVESYIREVFGRKGDKVVESNLKAFHSGREAVQL